MILFNNSILSNNKECDKSARLNTYIIQMMFEKYKIFISSTIDDLIEERNIVEKELVECEVFNVFRTENLPAMPDNSKSVCLDVLAKSDAVILVINNKYGYIPTQDNPTNLSVTHLEYREARRLSIDTYVFIKEGEKYDDKLNNFIKEISDFNNGVFRKKWKNKDDLRKEVKRSLVLWVAQKYSKEKSKIKSDSIKKLLQKNTEVTGFSIKYNYDTSNNTLQQWVKSANTALKKIFKDTYLPKLMLDVREEDSAENSIISINLEENNINRSITLELELKYTTENYPNKINIEVTDISESINIYACLIISIIYDYIDDAYKCLQNLLKTLDFYGISEDTKEELLIITIKYSNNHNGIKIKEIIDKILKLHVLSERIINETTLYLLMSEIRCEGNRSYYSISRIEKYTIQILSKALENNPSTYEYLYNLARKVSRKLPKVALSFYFELIKKEPSYEERWYYHRDIGLIYYHNANFKLAAQYYDQALSRRNIDSELFRFAGDAYYYSGMWANALVRYVRAVEIEPKEEYFLKDKIEFISFNIKNGNSSDNYFKFKRNISVKLSFLTLSISRFTPKWLIFILYSISLKICDLDYLANTEMALLLNRSGKYLNAISYLKKALAAIPESVVDRLNLTVNYIFVMNSDEKMRDEWIYHAKVAIFFGGPLTEDNFNVRLSNTTKRKELCDAYSNLIEIVNKERAEWQERRKEILKPEFYNGIKHIEIRE